MKFSLRLVGLACATWLVPASQTLGNSAGEAACPGFAAGESRGRIASRQINEASGIAASHRNPGVYYINNDSGSSARIFAVDDRGRDLGVYFLEGAKAIDWEDIAVGPARGEPGTFVYVADIGDNRRRRKWVTVYRVPEPEIPLDRAGGNNSLSGVVALRMQYPASAAHNAEVLLVDPQNADLYIVTKETKGPARVFRYPAPHRPQDLVILDEVGVLDLGPSSIPGSKWVTGGDISARRSQILLRTYSHVFLWNRSPGQSIAQAFSEPPCSAPQRREPQGEAIAWSLDEAGYVTVSEGLHQPLYFFARPPP